MNMRDSVFDKTQAFHETGKFERNGAPLIGVNQILCLSQFVNTIDTSGSMCHGAIKQLINAMGSLSCM